MREIRHVRITGLVQGVGYRAWVEQQASARGLEGWVRNCRDGTVEVLFAGPANVVSEMIASCRRGPLSARVEGLQEQGGTVQMFDWRRAGERFSVLPTYTGRNRPSSD